MSENGDGMEHLRIPFEKIKFGKKLEVQGYGSVFEGEFDDRRVALKRLNITNLGNVKPKLLAEILTISRFSQHPNLVALLGFVDEKSNEIILVYEYVPSGNLADKMRKRLTTIQRLEICLDAARGLDYLHTGVDPATPGIIHGNIKLSKILLNSVSNSSKFEAKLSSFGLSKVLPGQAQKTLGSTDPAEEVTVKATKKYDVYSFGVLMLEVLCGVPELVDTDDYQERHVTELVPKRLEQNRLREIPHRHIRNEIKTESLETYAKIACQCVMKNPEERPTMIHVVVELEKALRLQGGEVSNVQILGSRSINGAPEVTVVEDSNGVMLDSDVLEKEPEDVKIPIVVEEDNDVNSEESLDVSREDNGDEISVVKSSECTNGEKNAEEDITPERSFDVPILDSVDSENVPDRTHIDDPLMETSNTVITSTNVPDTTKEIMKDLNSIDKPTINAENEDDNQIPKIVTSSESNNGDTSSSNHSKNQDELTGDELEHLRIPLDKIKFGNKIDVHGYGSMFEGEFDHRQVALKRLNFTNLAHIKPKLLSEILTVASFRKHPNLVSLLGFCDEKSNEIILVYEYVSSGNLADKMSKHLTTIQRLEICLGAARGLDYLHTGVDSKTGIVHGDVKLSKILLNLDSVSSKFEAKVSGFGLSKLVPGQVVYEEVSKKVTKEFDVYSFGVLLLEVLCGVPELVDTDDYQERHVTELVPKRLQQNMLRKIVHFDIREEITTESLETYAKIACKCVMENAEERPTMAQVVEELEIALRLQRGIVSDVHILGSSNGNGLPEGTVDEDDREGDDNGETMGSNIADQEESKVIEEIIDDIVMQGKSLGVPNLDSEDGESVTDVIHIKGAKRENDESTNDPKSTEEIIADQESNEESMIIGENEVDNITTSKSNNGDDSNSAMLGQSFLGNENGENVTERIVFEEHNKSKEETMDDKITTMEITMEAQSAKAGKDAFLNLDHTEKKPNSMINVLERGFDDFVTNDKLKSIRKTQELESKRSNSSCSESSNGDGTTPLDTLLQKGPGSGNTMKKRSNGSRNCCSCSWWRFFSDRVALYGGLFWNKLVSFFIFIKGQLSRKHD